MGVTQGIQRFGATQARGNPCIADVPLAIACNSLGAEWLNSDAMSAPSRILTAPSYRKRRRRVRRQLVVVVGGVALAGVALLVLIGISFSV